MSKMRAGTCPSRTGVEVSTKAHTLGFGLNANELLIIEGFIIADAGLFRAVEMNAFKFFQQVMNSFVV